MVSSEPAKISNSLLQQEDECSYIEDVPLNEDHMQVHGVVKDTTAKEDAHDAYAADFSVAQECPTAKSNDNDCKIPGNIKSQVQIHKSQVGVVNRDWLFDSISFGSVLAAGAYAPNFKLAKELWALTADGD
jgi:hypothetical protein